MKIPRMSKTLLFTLCLVILGVIYAVFSFVRSSQQREASIPTLPSIGVTASDPDQTTQSRVDYSKVTITSSNVVQVVRELYRPENYYYETRSELFAGNSSLQYLRKTWKRGDWQRIDVLSSESATSMHIIYGKEKAFFWEPNSRSYYTANVGDITADDTQMMLSYEDILHFSPEEILSAEFTTYENQGCIYVVAQAKKTGYQTQYWISTEHGLLLAGQAQKDGSVFYTVKISALDLTVQEDVVFRLPDGTLPMNP